MPNRVFVVTGASSALGKALVSGIAQAGHTVVMVARDAGRGNSALQEIMTATQNRNIDMQLCDTSILSSVRNLAEILKSRYPAIDVLINNASVHKRKRAVTVDGFEEMFAANHLGPFLLTNLLLEQLQAAVQVNGSARVLNVTEPPTVPLDFDDIHHERNFEPATVLGATRMANLLFTLELARRLENTGITVNAISPGRARSELAKDGSFLKRLFARDTSAPLESVTGSILQAATAPEFEKMTGRFLQDGQDFDVPAYAQDHTAQERLWEISETLTQLKLTKGVTPINDPHLQ